MITVSIVSHGHARMIESLMTDLAKCPEVTRVILTLNTPEPEVNVPFNLEERTSKTRNTVPKGFAANHNAAFRQCLTPYFCVLNPDIRIEENPFPDLIACMIEKVALCAPAVLSPTGVVEDSVRHFPSAIGLFAKLLGLGDGRYRFERGTQPFTPEWVAGMFMLISSSGYDAVNGFDESYFLYYEDVDLCVRLWRLGYKIVVCPKVSVVHAAQRASHRNLRHLVWHMNSMARYFIRHWGRLPSVAG